MARHLANETELVAAAQAGNREAFSVLMGSCYEPTFRLAIGDDAEPRRRRRRAAGCHAKGLLQPEAVPRQLTFLYVDRTDHHQRGLDEDPSAPWRPSSDAR